MNSKAHQGTLLTEKGEKIYPAAMQAYVDQTDEKGDADNLAYNFEENPDSSQYKGDGDAACCLRIKLPKQICKKRERNHTC